MRQSHKDEKKFRGSTLFDGKAARLFFLLSQEKRAPRKAVFDRFVCNSLSNGRSL